MTPAEREARDGRLEELSRVYDKGCDCDECVLCGDIRSLLTEARKMREALETTVEALCQEAGPDPHDWSDGCNTALAVARRALGEVSR